jgi:hypothetical protein
MSMFWPTKLPVQFHSHFINRLRRVSISALKGASIGAVVLTGCVSWVPVNPLTPAVEESASRYGEVMANFSDQALLSNVLRAKDKKPLNFNDLSSISGSFSLSDTLGLTLPLGQLTGTVTGSTSHRFTASPSVTGTSSPTIALGTLNTQGFMMTMIQPISATYVLSKWDSYPHDLLLYLFVKAIRFPGEKDLPEGCVQSGSCETRRVYRNDPDSADFGDFKTLISQMTSETGAIAGRVDMKSLLILDPLGTPVPIGRTVSDTTPIPTPTPSVAAGPVPPTVRESATGDLAAGTYFTKITYVTASGETSPSGETPLLIQAHRGLEIRLSASPPPPAAGGGGATVTGYNVYIGTSSGGETKQNPAPVPPAQQWTLSSRLIQGSPPPGAPGTQYVVASDTTIFQTVNGLTDGQLHVGNARCPDYVMSGPHSLALCPPDSPFPFLRLYKEYQGQIVLCIRANPDTGKFGDHFIVAMSKSEGAARQQRAAANQLMTREQKAFDESVDPSEKAKLSDMLRQNSILLSRLDQIVTEEASKTSSSTIKALTLGGAKQSLASPAATPSPPSGGGGAPGGGGASGGAATTGGAGAMPQVTLALQPSRISGMLREEECKGDQIVLPEETEERFDRESSQFTHIEWRSISEVIEYLGALARIQEHPVAGSSARSSGIRIGAGMSDTLFTFGHGSAGQDGISVKYRGIEYRVPSAELATPNDHSLESLALVNELISIAKISGSLAVPQPVTVLP